MPITNLVIFTMDILRIHIRQRNWLNVHVFPSSPSRDYVMKYT